MPDFGYIGPATSKEEALKRLYQPHQYIAVDTETIGLKGLKKVLDGDEKVPADARTCIGFGIAISPVEAFYFPLGFDHNWRNVPANYEYFYGKALLENKNITKIFFNALFDLDRLEERIGVVATPFEDVSIAMQVQGLENSLEGCCNWYLGEDHQVISDILPSRSTMLDVEFSKTAWKCMNDCLVTYRLFNLIRLSEWNQGSSITWKDLVGFNYNVTPATQECYQVDHDCVLLLRNISKRGVQVRSELVENWYVKLRREMQPYEDQFSNLGFNPNSDQQVGYRLAERGNFLPLTKGKRQLKTDEETLLALNDPLANMVLSWRKREKLLSTYISPMRNKDRVYTHYRLDLATGRLASYEFNSQNLPPEVREIFAPDSNEFYWFDYSQIEFRIFAYQSKDPAMIAACSNPISPHIETLNALYPGKTKTDIKEYTQSKTFNFALLYDSDDKTLAKQTGLPLITVAKYRQIMNQHYPVAMRFIQERKESGLSAVPTDFGRFCKIPDEVYITLDHQEKCRNNYPTQGTAADIMKRAMLICDSEGMDEVFQVHDELVCDGYAEFRDILTNIHPMLPTPLESYHGAKWY